MKKIIASVCLTAFLALFAASCTNYVSCSCAFDIDNEVVDSVLWNAAGQPIYLKSSHDMPQEKTYLRDTVSTTGYCHSLNYYDPIGKDHPGQGVRTHARVTCWEK